MEEIDWKFLWSKGQEIGSFSPASQYLFCLLRETSLSLLIFKVYLLP